MLIQELGSLVYVNTFQKSEVTTDSHRRTDGITDIIISWAANQN